MKRIDLEKLFAEEQADHGHKTGCFRGTGVDWYTRRGGSGVRVIRVQWYAPRRTPKKPVMLYDGKVVEVGSDTVQKNELFPFTLEGLKAAVSFRQSHPYLTVD